MNASRCFGSRLVLPCFDPWLPLEVEDLVLLWLDLLGLVVWECELDVLCDFEV
jgi:hypothetical protein